MSARGAGNRRKGGRYHHGITGRGAAWLAHWSGGPGVAGSNPAVPTMDRILTIPNVLSFVRLGSVPVFVWLFVTDRRDAAVILYALGAWTDFFDGWIARRFDQVSELGKMLDPLADRVFIAALVVALVATDILEAWLAVAILGRDILILALYPVVQRAALTRIRVNFVDKCATAALLVGLTGLAISETSLSWSDILEIPSRLFVWVGAVLYWVSGALYARDALAMRSGGATGAA